MVKPTIAKQDKTKPQVKQQRPKELAMYKTTIILGSNRKRKRQPTLVISTLVENLTIKLFSTLMMSLQL